eukprot:12165951-Ditylum_brightwellii.AAC.1
MVSTIQWELIISITMSPLILYLDHTFELILLDQKKFKELGDNTTKYIMHTHPKTIAWMHSVSRVKGYSTGSDFVYHQHISLLQECKFYWPTNLDGDENFCGYKFV